MLSQSSVYRNTPGYASVFLAHTKLYRFCIALAAFIHSKIFTLPLSLMARNISVSTYRWRFMYVLRTNREKKNECREKHLLTFGRCARLLLLLLFESIILVGMFIAYHIVCIGRHYRCKTVFSHTFPSGPPSHYSILTRLLSPPPLPSPSLPASTLINITW